MELMEPRVYVTNFDIPSSIKIIENLTCALVSKDKQLKTKDA